MAFTEYETEQLLEKHELVPKRGTSMAAATVRAKSYMQMLQMLVRVQNCMQVRQMQMLPMLARE